MRLFPCPRVEERTSIPLSILDATVARFSPTGAIFLYDSFSALGDVDEKSFLDRLQASFVTAIAAFPHWAGQLQWTPSGPSDSPNKHFNRPMVVYGNNSDPGVEWTVKYHPLNASQIVPFPDTSGPENRVWLGNDFPESDLVSSAPLALHNLRDYLGLPAMVVQINILSGGGYAVGVRMAHVLADAQSLLVFMHHWAAASRALGGIHTPSPFGPPVFDPTGLDSQAAGDTSASVADPAVLQTALDLPLHRFDWWETSAPGYPPVMITNTENSRPTDPKLLEAAMRTPATSGPWNTWDLTRPVSFAVLHFPGNQLEALRAAARSTPGVRQDISRLDAVLAYMWRAINRARGLMDLDEKVYLNVTLGARTRVSKPLSESFIGSPIFLAHIGSPASGVCKAELGDIATHLRNTLAAFTPSAVGAMLHGLAHEVAPQRLWQGFLGSRHVLTTSWQHLKIYDVDFVGEGEGVKPRYVHAVMPKMDGCLVVMDSRTVGSTQRGGIDLCLYLDSESMGRLLSTGDLDLAK